MRFYTYIGIILTISILGGSCKSISSGVSWGARASYEDSVLLKVPPNGLIQVCSDDEEVGKNIIAAINTWADVIGRKPYLNIETTCSRSDSSTYINAKGLYQIKSAYVCSDMGELRYKVNKKAGSQTEIKEIKDPFERACDYDVLAVDVDHSVYQKDTQYTTYSVMLHEMGHLWGLCDQYMALDGKGHDTVANCNDFVQGHTNKNKQPRTVMGNGAHSMSTLTNDDIAGIQNVANFKATYVNHQWKEFLNSKNDPEKKILSHFNQSCVDQGYISIMKPEINGITNVFVADGCSSLQAQVNQTNKTETPSVEDTNATCSTSSNLLKEGFMVQVRKVRFRNNKLGYQAVPCRYGVGYWTWYE